MAEISWVILTIGHLSMNRFWGETERKRGALCTSTLLRTSDGLMIVDPSVHPPQMPDLLNDQAGVTPEDVRHVFLTHFHGDHRFGLEAFPHADWWMAEPEIAFWRERAGAEEQKLLDRITPLPLGGEPGTKGEGPLPVFLTVFKTGHTAGIAWIALRWRWQRFVVSGDAGLTYEFFCGREWFLNSTD
ncbi:MAG: MBL fold metallo-hydrolase, partial [Armatimonadetes bacterium]|nr:MBL fold metallo-hydrolase [Armatimonadota bacterium]